MRYITKKKSMIKVLAGLLVLALTVGSVSLMWNAHSLEVQAQKDTFPGVDEMRNSIMSRDETYYILEIVPAKEYAQLGYLMNGVEPYAALWDNDASMYQAWGQQLNALPTEAERTTFMNSLKGNVEAAVAAYGSDTAPFGWSGGDYTESGVTASTPGASSLTQSSFSMLYGYMDYQGMAADGNCYWQITPKLVSDVSVDTINSYRDSFPYYLTEPYAGSSELTYSQLYAWQTNDTYAKAMVCHLEESGKYRYVGTIGDAWSEVEAGQQDTVSGSDLVTVSDGNAGNVIVNDTDSGYFFTDFNLLTTDAVAEDYIYTLPALYAKDSELGVGNGNSKLVQVSTGPNTGYEIPAQQIFFTGYPTNQDLFRKQVLGLEGNETDYFRIKNYVITPSQLNEMQSNGSLENFLSIIHMVSINNTGVYNNTNDFTEATLNTLKSWIVEKEIPCLFDVNRVLSYSANGYQADSGCQTNMGKLAAYLLSSKKSATNRTLSNYLASTAGKADMAIDSDHDLNFVRDNVWFFNSTTHSLIRASLQDNAYDASLLEKGKDFGQVLTEIKLENQYREADTGFASTDRLSETVYDSTIWAYLINYSRTRAQIYKSSLKVLEIQPATNQSTLNVPKLSTLTGISEDKITVVTLPMNEFIGHIEDLNATYDMIYFGSSLDKLNTRTDQNTGVTIADYNDGNMDGLLYSHVGDLAVGMQVLGGLLKTDYKSEEFPESKIGANDVKASLMRFSGNDLTLDKYNALVEYLKASYPILIDDALLKDNKVNPDRVDNSSYLYEFLKKIVDDGSSYKNVFCWKDGLKDSSKTANFEFYANRPKLKLIADSSYPNLIMTDKQYAINSAVSQIEQAEDGHYYLQFRFKIQNSGAADYNSDYTCKMYLDANADGKFSDINEELTGVSVVDTSGNSIDYDKLKADTWYTVTRVVPDSYYGCITWNLEVQQKSNSGVRASQSGYTKLVRPAGTAAAKIKILQIYYANDDRAINLEKSIGKWNESTGSYGAVNASDDGYVSRFRGLAEDVLDDYILDITTISKTTFESGTIDGVPIDLDDYDMLILGFSDAKAGVDWDKADVVGKNNTIQAFIESGRSVLFAHDMTSFVNANYSGSTVSVYYQGNKENGSVYNWNYSMNTYVRDLVGMDIYGITTGNLDSTSPYAVLKNGEALVKKDASYDGINAPVKDGDYYVLGTKDIAYAPKSGRSETVAEVQGYSATILNQYNDYAEGYHLAYRNGMGISHADNKYTSSVRQINEGQITNFPFAISKSFSIAQTHGQYYSLEVDGDADRDGESDVVVWYTLSGSDFNNSYNDVKNNYYIYNKGNVTYTGMGHSKSGVAQVTEYEAKLFINTMVAAYNSGVRKPEITVKDSSGSTTNTIYNYYDSLVKDNSEVDVYFSIDDPNMTMGSKKLSVRFYAEDNVNGQTGIRFANEETAGYVAENTKLTDVTNKLVVYHAGTNTVADISNLTPDTMYYVKVPASYFSLDNNGYATDFYIGAKTVITKSNGTEPTYTPWTVAKVEYVNVELFDLD